MHGRWIQRHCWSKVCIIQLLSPERIDFFCFYEASWGDQYLHCILCAEQFWLSYYVSHNFDGLQNNFFHALNCYQFLYVEENWNLWVDWVGNGHCSAPLWGFVILFLILNVEGECVITKPWTLNHEVCNKYLIAISFILWIKVSFGYYTVFISWPFWFLSMVILVSLKTVVKDLTDQGVNNWWVTQQI